MSFQVGDIVRCKIYRHEQHELLCPLPVGQIVAEIETDVYHGGYYEVRIFDRRLGGRRLWRLFACELIYVPRKRSEGRVPCHSSLI